MTRWFGSLFSSSFRFLIAFICSLRRGNPSEVRCPGVNHLIALLGHLYDAKVKQARSITAVRQHVEFNVISKKEVLVHVTVSKP